MAVQIDADLSFSASAATPVGTENLGFSLDGFNDYGVRVNRDANGEVQSVEAIYRAMEPGVRNQILVTEGFLGRVAGNFSSPVPLQMDHSRSQFANVGTVRNVWNTSDAFWLRVEIPNTGSTVRADVIADFTHEPPAITDGSVGFGRDYEIQFNEDADTYELVNATLEEFSLTPFPAGYDSGGLSPVFSAAFEAATSPTGTHADTLDDVAHDGSAAEIESDAPTRSRARVFRNHARISELNHEVY